MIREIDRLKNISSQLNDSDRVDCLNAISSKYGFTILPGKTDSMFNYAMEANKEGNKIGYKAGIANSWLNLARSKRYSKQKDDGEKYEKYVRQALLFANEIKNDQIFGEVYYLLAGLENKEENYKKAIQYFKKSGDLRQETEVTTWLCMMYTDKGEYEGGFPYCDSCIQLAKRNIQYNKTEWDHELVQWSLFDMAELYKLAGDYETAIDYLNQFNNYAIENNLIWKNYIDIELYCLMGKYDSALHYLQSRKMKNQDVTKGKKASDNTSLGFIYLNTNEIDKAIPLFLESIEIFRDKEWGNISIIKPSIYAGMAYLAKGNYNTALKYTAEAFSLAKKHNAKKYLIDAYELLSKIYHHLGKNDLAYFNLLQYTRLKDSIFTRQFLWRLNNYKKAVDDAKKESRIGFLNRDNKIKEEQLKQEASLKKFLIAGLISLLITAIFIFRYFAAKRKNEKLASEKKQAELQQGATELEMQALRAQMNPHFIFNCLSSINKFILKNDTDTASDYLTRFSRLIRQSLTNSQLSVIPLSDEIEMLRLYLDMERLRFSESFTYNIVYENTIEPETIYIPPMLLQPFCENAIWHGLMHKEGPGKLEVIMSLQNGELQCIIADNGVGREKAAELKSRSNGKQKSFGLKITTERLALFNNEKAVSTFYKTEDVLDSKGKIAGTMVILNIKFKNTTLQPVKELHA